MKVTEEKMYYKIMIACDETIFTEIKSNLKICFLFCYKFLNENACETNKNQRNIDVYKWIFGLNSIKSNLMIPTNIQKERKRNRKTHFNCSVVRLNFNGKSKYNIYMLCIVLLLVKSSWKIGDSKHLCILHWNNL